jgi:antitoxin YefM
MTTLNATEARSKLYSLIDETSTTHQPVLITGKRGNAVLLAEEDWNAINETLYLLSVPGMRESIHSGIKTNLGDCDKAIDWYCGQSIVRSRLKKMPGNLLLLV